MSELDIDLLEVKTEDELKALTFAVCKDIKFLLEHKFRTHHPGTTASTEQMRDYLYELLFAGNCTSNNKLDIAMAAMGVSDDITEDIIGDRECIYRYSELKSLCHNVATAVDIKGNESIKRVYAGGDAVRGPSTLVKAVGDGRAAAKSIIWEESKEKEFLEHKIKTSSIDLLKRKSKKNIIDKHFSHDYDSVKRDFTEVDGPIDEIIAKEEANRCLLCSDMCSICVTVCPNLANVTYQITPFQREMSILKVQNSSLIQIKDTPYRVSQPFQILNIVDFCNECGNCATFCPTKGAPYKDKPKIFLKEEDFNDYEITYNAKCYFIKVDEENYIIKGKINNKELHELKMNKKTEILEYKNSDIELVIDGKTFEIKDSKLLVDAEQGTEYSLIQYADMYTIIKGMRESLSFFPQFQ